MSAFSFVHRVLVPFLTFSFPSGLYLSLAFNRSIVCSYYLWNMLFSVFIEHRFKYLTLQLYDIVRQNCCLLHFPLRCSPIYYYVLFILALTLLLLCTRGKVKCFCLCANQLIRTY